MDKNIEAIVKEVIKKINQNNEKCIPVEASGRHIHLSEEDAIALFGTTELTVCRELSQPGQYLYTEKVNLIGKKGILKDVAILGPCRGKTQVEISLTDARALGIKGALRDSGNLAGAESIIVTALDKCVRAENSVIIARRHIHMKPEDAKLLGVKDNQEVSVRVTGARPLIFEKVLVRVNEKYSLSMHIDYDEANAVGLNSESKGFIVGEANGL